MISLITMMEFDQGGTMIDKEAESELIRRKNEYGSIWRSAPIDEEETESEESESEES